jgi:TorA maturation chaperone TorD
MAAEYAAIYLTHAYSIAPVESVWVDEDGLERQEPMFRVREWSSRFGFEAPDWRKRSDDHIAHELAFLSNVSDRLSDPAAAQGVARFMTEHPLVWFHDFAGRVTRRCQSPFYAALALLTAAYLDRFADMLARLYGFDMTPKPARPPQAQPNGPTCGDAPPRFVPGAGPGW